VRIVSKVAEVTDRRFPCAKEGCAGTVTYSGRKEAIGAERRRMVASSKPFTIYLRCDAPDGHVKPYVISAQTDADA
jgi:hypothetical protein